MSQTLKIGISLPKSFEHIRVQLLTYGIDDIDFLIINDHQQHAIDNVGELARRVNFPIYQDTNRSRIWNQLGGGKDDTFIYDRCGRLTHHIPYPRSILRRRDFQMALWVAYYNNPCNCDPATIGTHLHDQHANGNHADNNQQQGRHHGGGNHGNGHHGHGNHEDGHHGGGNHGNGHHGHGNDGHGHHGHGNHGDGHQHHHGNQHAGSRHHRSAPSDGRRYKRHLRQTTNDVNVRQSDVETVSVRRHNSVPPKYRVLWHSILFHHKGFGRPWK